MSDQMPAPQPLVAAPQPLVPAPAPLAAPPAPLVSAPQPLAEPTTPAPAPTVPAPAPTAAPTPVAAPAFTPAPAPTPVAEPEPVPAAAPVAEPLPVAQPVAPPIAPAVEPPTPQSTSGDIEEPTGYLDPYDPQAVVARFAAMLRALAVDGVSDIHFKSDQPAWPVAFGRPQKSGVVASRYDLLSWVDVFGSRRGGARELAEGERGTVECMAAVEVAGESVRLRMTFYRENTGLGMTLRIVPSRVPSVTDSVFHRNPLPQSLIDLTLNVPAGLVLFCGPTGSGKTTANAALLNEVNQTQSKHIYSVEDPIEFIHESKMSAITQREIGEHADTFPHALKTSLRSRPNIILVGELLDLETVRVAIEAANKGHLVFSTSHASSAEEAISSLVSQFPGSEQNQVSTALAQALKAVMVQRLIPSLDGKVVPARELLINNIAISSKIRERQYTSITQALKLTDGMYQFEDDLAMLWAQGQIDEAAAFKYCNDRNQMQSKLKYANEHKQEVAARAGFTPVRFS